ncbi:MAG: TRAP transporter large permease subunit [Xanthomonadales bacterium]|nr:TRAP transporter large permease subunit [Xanthomonadales bacterium]
MPPGVPLVLEGIATRSSIAELFLAGVLPGLLLSALIAARAARRHRRRDAPAGTPPLRAALGRSLPALGTPVLLLGGPHGGWSTATEAGAVAVLCAALPAGACRRRPGLGELRACALETATVLRALFPAPIFAFSLNLRAAAEGLPAALAAALGEGLGGPLAFLLAVNLLLLLLGCVLDAGSAIPILARVLDPAARAFGLDPVHFGVVIVMSLEIGDLTPPLGLTLIVASALFRLPLREVCLGALPFAAVMLLALAAVSLFPTLALRLPGR